MKLGEIFRFEIGYQARRFSTWLYCAVLLGLTFRIATAGLIDAARSGGYVFNGSFVIAELTVLGSLMGLVVAAALAGDAGARDAQTRMHPLVHAAPVGKVAYLGGRFLAAFVLHALILLAVPVAVLLATHLPGLDPELLGPPRPEFYLGAYAFIALPSAFVATALLFAVAALGRRAIASYVCGALLFFGTLFNWMFVADRSGRWELAKLLDPLGLTMLSEISRAWTPIEKSTRPIALEGDLLTNRLLWLGIALGVLALTWFRFRFAHPGGGAWWSRLARTGDARSASQTRERAEGATAASAARGAPLAVPEVPRAFDVPTRVRQTLVVAGESFRVVVTSWGGIVLAALAVIMVLSGPGWMQHLGVPLLPTTGSIVGFLGNSQDLVWVVVPLLIVFYAGELVWREREAGMSEITDAAPVPDWVCFVGKFLGLALVLVALQALMMAASMLVQVNLGYHDFEPGLYVKVLFGLQLADYLLFVLLALAVHVVVDQKYVAHMVALIGFAFMNFAPSFGVEHNLLVYGSDPGWTYSDMRGFGPFLGPVLWFKLLWMAWALLLALATRLLWVRGRVGGLASRLHIARHRLTRRVAGAAAMAAALVLVLGGFVFYNTNVLNEYRTVADELERRAEYERRYRQHESTPQPRLSDIALHVEIHPGRGAVEIRGSYGLVNGTEAAIDSVHLVTASGIAVRRMDFDRPSGLVHVDEALGHRIHVLETPLQPGDSMRLAFEVRAEPRGFPNAGIDASVSASGTFMGREKLPAIGYQRGRELGDPGDRLEYGLQPRPRVRSLGDREARHDLDGEEQVAFEAVVGTAAGQVAFAPGALRRTWTDGGRRYFHYATDVPIRHDFAIFSAAYAVREARWNDVVVQVAHHPRHAHNVGRMIRSLQASLDYHTRKFGPYPHGQIRLVEHPGRGISLHAYPVNISYQEGFSRLDPDDDLDFPFAVVAHEVAHQWWGNQVMPARVEGAALLSESLAWYTAMGVVEETLGVDHLRRLLGAMRTAYLTPRARAGVPLLRASDSFLAYRRGPFAMYALREYVGEARVNAALRRLLETHGAGRPPLPTSLDLYGELQAVTPDSLQYLLVDLFEKNTFWELEVERVTAERVRAPRETERSESVPLETAEAEAAEPGGAEPNAGRDEAAGWRVAIDVRARKVIVDTLGFETEVPMDDLVEVGVYPAADDGEMGVPLYLRRHRIRSGAQRIVVTVPEEPARAGIDPRSLLIDTEAGDNLADVTGGDAPPPVIGRGGPSR